MRMLYEPVWARLECEADDKTAMPGMPLNGFFSAGVSALAGAIKDRPLAALEVVESAYQKIDNWFCVFVGALEFSISFL